MLFGKKTGTCGYELVKEGQEDVMRINCLKCSYTPYVADSPVCMMRTIDKLVEAPSVGRIIFAQKRNYEYSYEQTQMLVEIANLYNHLVKQKRALSLSAMGTGVECTRCFPSRHADVQYIIFNLLRSDPLGAYVELKRLIREAKIRLKKWDDVKCVECEQVYTDLLSYLFDLFGKTKLISIAKPYLSGYVLGERSLYRDIFRPAVRPNFMFTRLMAQQPLDGEELDTYSVKDTDITIFSIPGDIKYLYHVTPPEFKISEDEYELLDLARNVLIEHRPRAEEFLDPERMRNTFFNIGRDLLQELVEQKDYDISYDKIKELAKILVRYTIGFGLVETLLEDKKIQDIVINGPIGQTPIFIVHQDFDECVTNIIPSNEDGEGWASKFRMLSGRPLDEANPVLDTELLTPGARARVAIMSKPLNPLGLAYAFRRHRDTPWTYPLFIENRMMTPLAAGLLSFMIDGARTMLIAGTRSSGKTSLLGATLVEIMRKYRIITVEDTLELPTEVMRELGYNIQPMKVRAALMAGGGEVPADEGIRTSLRLGDSSLIVGEVRSLEAKALFEAMRIGALANVVAGTIHGASPYGVFDRVVNDLGVPRTSFKATDVIVVANPIKSSDGLHKWKRMLQIAEVRKHWEEDPLREAGFVDLMKYDSKTDQLEPTDDLINGESEVLKDIAGNVREWAGDWDAVWENIQLRAMVKEALVNHAKKSGIKGLLEAKFVVNANDQFHRDCDSVKEEVGALDSKKIFFRWEDWLKKQIKKSTFK